MNIRIKGLFSDNPNKSPIIHLLTPIEINNQDAQVDNFTILNQTFSSKSKL